MFLKHECIFSEHFLELFFKAGVIFGVNEVVFEENKSVHFLFGFLILLFLKQPLTTIVLVFVLKSAFTSLQHFYLELERVHFALDLPLNRCHFVLKVTNRSGFLVDFLQQGIFLLKPLLRYELTISIPQLSQKILFLFLQHCHSLLKHAL